MSSSKSKTAMEKSPDIRVAGETIDDEEWRKFLIPEHLRFAMMVATRALDAEIGEEAARKFKENHWEEAPVEPKAPKEKKAPKEPKDKKAPKEKKAPLVVFVDCKGGGILGHQIKVHLQKLISEDQVFDISLMVPFLLCGLTCLTQMEDQYPKPISKKLRIMIAGGDGEVGKILRHLGKFSKGQVLVPPIGIIPLGTGNDLSKSFGWGGSLPSAWSSAVESSLREAAFNRVEQLDSWSIKIVMKKWGKKGKQKQQDSLPKGNITQSVDMQTELPANLSKDGGVFYKYFSIGMDAEVKYNFNNREKNKPSLAQGPIPNKSSLAQGPIPNKPSLAQRPIPNKPSLTQRPIPNKLSFVAYSCTQEWFCTPCIETKGSRELENILTLHVKKVHRDNWEEVIIPSSIRAITFLNIHNYGGGAYPWGHLKPEYLEEKKYYEAHPDDGLLEIFGLKQGWHASCVMAQLTSAKHIAQAAAIKVELRSNACFIGNETFIQVDGEPGKLKLEEGRITELTIEKFPFRPSFIIGNKAGGNVTSKKKKKEI